MEKKGFFSKSWTAFKDICWGHPLSAAISSILFAGIIAVIIAGTILTGCVKKQAPKETADYRLNMPCAPIHDQACQDTPAFLEKIGLFGEHKLERFRSNDSLSGSISGGLFFFSGSFSGEFASSEQLKFAWRYGENKSITSFLPVKLIVREIDEEKKEPTVRFFFNMTTIIQDELKEDYNLNAYINPKYVIYAKVFINSENLKKEVYLPF